MLADVHVLMALRGLWARVAGNRANFDGIFAKMAAPPALVDQWYAGLCPGGDTKHLCIDEGLVHGRTRPPALLVELGALEEFERLLGEGRLGAARETSTMLRSNVTVTCWAPTKLETVGLSILTLAMLRYAHGYFARCGYMGQGLVRGQDLTPWEDLAAERQGNFRRRISWRLEREYRFPPLLGDEPIETTIVLHHEDAVDAYGNPGTVSPREVSNGGSSE